ncbi:MAG: prepilin-type N-terminal cleavage/methylation domain-containing protein [Psychrilyobacter sp.]|nr:prepilin-type N-terminal cleavage/methylation domain-containing protein [Psychrilyobacter sp.]
MVVKKQMKSKAFTLIEALVALTILLMGMFPVVTIANRAIFYHQNASKYEEAGRLSQTMVDYIKSRGYDELKLMIDNSNDLSFKEKYEVIKDGSSFTVEDFGYVNVFSSDDDFNIEQDLIVLNSKGINLNAVTIYIEMDNINGVLKKTDETNDLYIDPPTGQTRSDVYDDDIIYGKIVFGMGSKLESSDPNLTDTGRSKEVITTFIITPLENWK